jgi:hypothetical protein
MAENFWSKVMSMRLLNPAGGLAEPAHSSHEDVPDHLIAGFKTP